MNHDDEHSPGRERSRLFKKIYSITKISSKNNEYGIFSRLFHQEQK